MISIIHDNSDEVCVRYPHHWHGLTGKPSNSSKQEAKASFLEFIDLNSQPNGRQAECHCATHYILPKFKTIQTPKLGVRNYEQRLSQSVVGEFNRVLREQGYSTISNYSASVWLRQERPKHAIYPHQKDYCDTCAKIKKTLQSKRMSMSRPMQSRSASEVSQTHLQSDITHLQTELDTQRDHAMKSHKHYSELRQRCRKEWEEIKQLEGQNRTDEEEQKLATLRHSFTLTMSADYQMSKLVPYWGLSPQPSSIYYLQKLSHNIFGVVDHREDKACFYIFNEIIGPKNTDHTASYLTEYMRHNLPVWLRRVHIFVDNAGSTNKNFCLMSWAMEIVQQKVLDFIRISFLIASHTKFSVDQPFSRTTREHL